MICLFEKRTGYVTWGSIRGNAAFLKKRGASKIHLLPDEQLTRKEWVETRPSLKDGDSIITGEKSFVTVSTSYDSGKQTPNDNGMLRRFNSVNVYPDSEISFGVEEWAIEDNKNNTKTVGSIFTKIKLVAGTFHVTPDDEIELPVGALKFLEKGSGALTIEISNGSVYILKSSEKRLEVKTKTGKSYIAQSKLPEEIIITRDAIYRKTTETVDERLNQLSTCSFAFCADPFAFHKDSESLNEQQVGAMKNMTSNLKQAETAMAMIKTIKPEELSKMGLTPEQIKDTQQGIQMMESSDMLNQMKVFGEAIKQFNNSVDMEKYGQMMKEASKKRKEVFQIDENVGIEPAYKRYKSRSPFAPIDAKDKVA